MSKREYSDPSGSGHKIYIASDGTDVRVRVVYIDYDGNEYGGMVDMPINDLRDMFKEADEEERYDADINRAIETLISASEGVYHSCESLEVGVPKNADVAALCRAANKLMAETHYNARQFERALKDYRLSQIPGRK